MARLGVLGTLVWDTIHPPEEAAVRDAPAGDAVEEGPPRSGPVERWGGISYSLSTFEAVGPRGWTAVPILKVGRDLREEAEAYLASLGGVDDLEGVRWVDEPNNRVLLRYRPDGTRTETLSGGVPAWRWEELEPLALRCDALYVNLIAGWEVDLATAQRLRSAFDGPIYCDLHSLLLEREEGEARRRRAPDGWRRWLRCFDVLQLNRDELATLAEDAGRDPWDLGEEIVHGPVELLLVTLGTAGAAWIASESFPGRVADVSSGQGPVAESRRGHVPVRRPVRPGDPTGCGDVWGMACLSSLLTGSSVGESTLKANRVARWNALCRGPEGLSQRLAGEGEERPSSAGEGKGPGADSGRAGGVGVIEGPGPAD